MNPYNMDSYVKNKRYVVLTVGNPFFYLKCHKSWKKGVHAKNEPWVQNKGSLTDLKNRFFPAVTVTLKPTTGHNSLITDEILDS